MKILQQDRELDQGGILEQRQATVSLGAHTMQILSGLYKNPIEACVREYATNMFDAIIALKRENPGAAPQPCVIRGPNAFEPWLEFEDFGCGMTIEQAWKNYNGYGESTKGDSNDEVGGFGIGCKAAHAYNGGGPWAVRTRRGGMEHYFQMGVDKKGIPFMALVYSKPTDEPSGTLVRLPVRRSDHEAAWKAIVKFYPYFTFDLKVEGDGVGQCKKHKHPFQGDGWALREKGFDSDLYVVMGNVPYPIEAGWNQSMNDWVPQWAKTQPITLYLPIGSLEIVPSRDALKNTPENKARVHAAFKSMQAQLLAQREACKTHWQRLHFDDRWKEYRGYANQGLIPRYEWKVEGMQSWGTDVQGWVIDDHKPLWNQLNSVKLHRNFYIILNTTGRDGLKHARKWMLHKFIGRDSAGARDRSKDLEGAVLVLTTTKTPEELSKLAGDIPLTHIIKDTDLGAVPNPPNTRQQYNLRGLYIVKNGYKLTPLKNPALLNEPRWYISVERKGTQRLHPVDSDRRIYGSVHSYHGVDVMCVLKDRTVPAAWKPLNDKFYAEVIKPQLHQKAAADKRVAWYIRKVADVGPHGSYNTMAWLLNVRNPTGKAAKIAAGLRHIADATRNAAVFDPRLLTDLKVPDSWAKEFLKQYPDVFDVEKLYKELIEEYPLLGFLGSSQSIQAEAILEAYNAGTFKRNVA